MSTNSNYNYLFDPMMAFVNENGEVIKGGFLNVFLAGTSTKVTTYANWNLTANPVDIPLDDAGRIQNAVIVPVSYEYKVLLLDEDHDITNPIKTFDNLTAGKVVQNTGTVTQGLNSVTVTGQTICGSVTDNTLTITETAIHALTNTATESDIASGNYFAIDGGSGTKKLPANLLAKASALTAEENTRKLGELTSPLSFKSECEQGKIASDSSVEASAYRIHTGWLTGDGNSYTFNADGDSIVGVDARRKIGDTSVEFGYLFGWTSSVTNLILVLEQGYQYCFSFAKGSGSTPSSTDEITPEDVSVSLKMVNPFPVTLNELDTNHYVTPNANEITLIQGGWNSSGYQSRSDRLHTEIITGEGQTLNLVLDDGFVCLNYSCTSADGKDGAYGDLFNWKPLSGEKVTLASGKYYVFLVARDNGSGSAASTSLTTSDCNLLDFVSKALILQHEDEIGVLQGRTGSYTKTLLDVETKSANISKFTIPSSGYTAGTDCITSTADNGSSSAVVNENLYAIDKRSARLVFKPASASSYCEIMTIPPVVSTTGTGAIVDFSSNRIQLFGVAADRNLTLSTSKQLSNVGYVSGHKYIIELVYDCPNNIARVYDETTGAMDEISQDYVEGSSSMTSGFHKGNYAFVASNGVEVYHLSVYSAYEHPYVMFFGASQNEASYFVNDHTNYVDGQIVAADASTMRNGFAYKFIDEVLESSHKGLVSGISGTSWNEVYKRLQSEAVILRPDYVVIMVGNNSWSESAAKNCIELLEDNGINVLLFDIPAAYLVDGSGGITGNKDYATIAARNGYINALRNEYDLEGAKVNISNSLNNDGEKVDTSIAFYTSGYFPHPNHSGVAKIIGRIKLDLPWLK